MTPQVFYVAELVFFGVETLMLGGILWQGELIRRYEKWTYEMTRERYEERARWRKQKQQQAIKKNEPFASGAKNTESPQPSTTPSETPKTGAAESVEDPKAILTSH